MLQLKRALGTCMFISALVSIVAAQAETYYVATTGNNSNPGTEAKPWRTVGHAVATMVAGDTTYVRGGTYNNEGVIRFSRSGTAEAPIKLLNYPGESPIIDFQTKSSDRRLLIQHSAGYNRTMAYITIEGFEIKNSRDGIKWYNLQDGVIRRNWIHHNIGQGILGGGGLRVSIDRNILSDNGNFVDCYGGTTRCNQQHGLYAYGQQYTITNNLIYGNMGSGIQQNGSSTSFYSSSKNPSPSFADATDWLIANNTIAYQVNASAIVVWGSRCFNARIENNILYENRNENPPGTQGVGFTSATSSTGIKIRNNHFYASGNGGTVAIASGAPGDLVTSGNIINVSAPGFVNAGTTRPASPNFALTGRSPAIDAGLTLPVTRTSFDGTPRPQGRAPDIGAYEYTIDGDAQSPIAPKGLRAH